MPVCLYVRMSVSLYACIVAWTARMYGPYGLYGFMDVRMRGWMNGCVGGWMDAWLDGWMYGMMDAWMHGWMLCVYVYV